MQTKRKATSQTIWIIIVIVVALAVAMILLILMNKITGKAGDSAEDTLDTSGSTLKRELCNADCKACIRIYGDAECQTHWPDMLENNGCQEIMPNCVE